MKPTLQEIYDAADFRFVTVTDFARFIEQNYDYTRTQALAIARILNRWTMLEYYPAKSRLTYGVNERRNRVLAMIEKVSDSYNKLKTFWATRK